MRYKIQYRSGMRFAETEWSSDAFRIVYALSYTSPMCYDVIDSATGTIYKYEEILRKTNEARARC